MPENEEAAPATEAQPEAAQPAEATSTAKASDELSEDDLEAAAGGGPREPSSFNSVPGYNKGPKGSQGYILGLPIRPGS